MKRAAATPITATQNQGDAHLRPALSNHVDPKSVIPSVPKANFPTVAVSSMVRRAGGKSMGPLPCPPLSPRARVIAAPGGGRVLVKLPGLPMPKFAVITIGSDRPGI